MHLSGIWEAGLLSAFASLGLILGMVFTPDNGKNFVQRFSMLMGIGLFTGHSLGLLLEQVIYMNPAIVVTALVGTTTIFACLTASAFFAKRGKYLYLGGILMSALSTMALINLGNLFFRSYIVQDVSKRHLTTWPSPLHTHFALSLFLTHTHSLCLHLQHKPETHLFRFPGGK